MALPKTTQQPIINIDATPDNNYPLRILQAYRENCNCKWASDTDNPLIERMNEDCDERAKVLDAAISLLSRNNEAA